MEKYKISTFNRNESGQRLLRNTLNILLGASLVMKHTTFSLRTVFSGECIILFETNNSNFVSNLELELSNYGLHIAQTNINIIK